MKEFTMQTSTANGATLPALGFGTFRMSGAEVLRMVPHALKLDFRQIEYHPYLDQQVMISTARKAGLSVTGYYGMADGKVFAEPILKEIGARHRKSVAQVVLRWLVQQDGVIALSKTVSEARAAENLT